MRNIGRAIPSLGWMGIVYPITTACSQRAGHGFLPAIIALVALGIPPIVTNTYAGLREVDPDLQRGRSRRRHDANSQLLARVEVPVALPVVLAGMRSSAVAIVATTPLMSIVGADTLGDLHPLGPRRSATRSRSSLRRLLVVVLRPADRVRLRLLERRVTSPGLTGRTRARPCRSASSRGPSRTRRAIGW